MHVRRALLAACAACCVLVALTAGPLAADRDARVITPSGSPVSLDPWRALLFDSPAVLVVLRNGHTAPVTTGLRIWIFDPDLRLRGSVDYCTTEVRDRATRGHVFVPLELPGVTLRDHAVVTVAAVGSGRTAWSMRESEAEQRKAARAAARGAPAHLALNREDGGLAAWDCPCEPQAVEALCVQRCADTGLAAHAATRLLGTGCSATCACR